MGSMASWLFAGVSANAQIEDVYPIYYKVYNVASNDVLNVRADSDSGALIIGSLDYNGVPIEILRQEHNWGYVSMGERMGWVSMTFLQQIVPATVGESPIPAGLLCGGTEPFWGFSLSQSRIEYSDADGGDANFNIVSSGGFAGFAGQDGFVQASGTKAMATAVFSTNLCSDGMSERDYGWRVDLVLTGQSGAKGYSGCCHLPMSP